MADIPAPFTPADCDLRGMPYMPLDIVRLFDSDLYALSTGDEFKAALTLWGKSFLQIPAGSLPNDERILAHLSGAGSNWRKVREMALRGWIKCTDGRLHHAVVAEKARDAWDARVARRARTEAARAAKQQKTDTINNNGTPSGGTDDDTENVAMSVTEENPPVTTSVTEPVTGSKGREGKRREEKKERFSLPSVAEPACREAAAPAEAPPEATPPPAPWPPPPLATAAPAVVGNVVATLTGRRRGAGMPAPQRPTRTPEQQIAALGGNAGQPPAKGLAPDQLAEARRLAGIGAQP